MDYWTEKLRKLIPTKEYKRIMDSPFCELEADFLCFSDIYGSLAELIPKDKIILDLGCYAGLQSYFFCSHKGYLGIDATPMESRFPKPEHDYLWYVRNLELIPEYFNQLFQPRVNCPNSQYICATIQDYIKGLNMEQLLWHNENCFAIMSYVPDREAFDMANKAFHNFAWYYPGGDYYDGNKIRLNGNIMDFNRNFIKQMETPVLEDVTYEIEYD
jgi:hypothetical protein